MKGLYCRYLLLFAMIFIANKPLQAQQSTTASLNTGGILEQRKAYSRADTLRGSITPERAWWNALHYDVTVRPDYASKSLLGSVKIVFALQHSSIAKNSLSMQLDLQQPLVVDSVVHCSSAQKLSFTRSDTENVFFVRTLNAATKPRAKKDSLKDSLIVYYHGVPREAVRPPWDGGWIWTKDSLGRAWMSVACQGLGASVWYPCKDHQSDEPDNGASLTVIVPDTLVAVGNGRLIRKTRNNDGTAAFTWQVRNPINTYNLVPYIGRYVHWQDTLRGEKGALDLDFWVLDYDSTKAYQQFSQVKPMLRCFEHWFGAYPFYEDGYKLVQSLHLGMEHQSAVAYGNLFKNGYRGRDLSGTGIGLKWDFIIVHESGHEWFANNITTKDIADMWVHEGFTCFSETLFTEWLMDKGSGRTYNRGLRRNVLNDEPIIAAYNLNQAGSGDMYYKAANMIQAIRTAIDDDKRFRALLRGLNSRFYHATVTTKDIENYINRATNIDFSTVFDQYLRTTDIPVLRYAFSEDSSRVAMRWDSCVKGFRLPLVVGEGAQKIRLLPTERTQIFSLKKYDQQWFLPIDIEQRYFVRVLQDKTLLHTR